MTIQPFKSDFNIAAHVKTEARKKRPPPFSMRFSDEERAQLDHARGVLSLAAYIRLKLFTDEANQRSARKKLVRKHSSPSAELAMLSQMLGGLGQSRLASNLNQIAKAANIGALPVSPDLEQELLKSCAAVQDMKRELLSALGVSEK